MLRRLLFLVLVLPYFLPQGVCICDLVQTCDACTVSEEPAPRRCCGCHKHKHAVPAQSEQASALRSAHTCHHGTPGKTPEHVPCCPAKTGTPLVKQTSTPLTGLAVLGFDGPFTVVPAAVPTCSSDTAGLLVAVGQPLYLSLLQLRI